MVLDVGENHQPPDKSSCLMSLILSRMQIMSVTPTVLPSRGYYSHWLVVTMRLVLVLGSWVLLPLTRLDDETCSRSRSRVEQLVGCSHCSPKS